MNQQATDPAHDRALIARARSGDTGAFEQLVAENSGRVHGALRRFGLDAQEADEVAQEVFVRAWRGLPKFEERSRFSTWLYRIAFNEAQRHRSRRPLPTTPDEPGDIDVIAEFPDTSASGPQAHTLDHEFQQVLARALVQLPPDLRAAVILRDLEGLSTEEAASATGVRQSAFKSRLHRGRMQLRRLLEPYLQLEQAQ